MTIDHKFLAVVFVGCFLALLVLGVCAYVVMVTSQSETRTSPLKYANVLAELKSSGYQFRFPWENLTGKTAVLIHDVDYSFEGAETLAQVERDYDVRSVFYLRPDAAYFLDSIGLFQDLEADGWKIGLHYDSLSRADGNESLALMMFQAQIAYLRSYFNIRTTSYHGDAEYRVDIINLDLYTGNQETWRNLGLFEVYSLGNYSYIRDTDGVFIQPDPLKDLVVVQLHADYW